MNIPQGSICALNDLSEPFLILYVSFMHLCTSLIDSFMYSLRNLCTPFTNPCRPLNVMYVSLEVMYVRCMDAYGPLIHPFPSLPLYKHVGIHHRSIYAPRSPICILHNLVLIQSFSIRVLSDLCTPFGRDRHVKQMDI